MAVFVWTFDGVVRAVILAVCLSGALLGGLIVAWVKLLEWLDRRKANRRAKR